MPSLTTLIPAYKGEYLGATLASLSRQTWRDFRVLVSDDSPDRLITRQFEAGMYDAQAHDLDIIVMRGPCQAYQNHHALLQVWNGVTPLVHWLMDDDVVEPDFYARHVSAHAAMPTAVSVSARDLIDAAGCRLGTPVLPDEWTGPGWQEVARTRLFSTTVLACQNWLGELSHMVFSAAAARSFPKPTVDASSYFGLPDMGLVLAASATGPVRFTAQPLGGFRQHASQSTKAVHTTALQIAHAAWGAFAVCAGRARDLSPALADQALAHAESFYARVYGRSWQGPGSTGTQDNFLDFWSALLQSSTDAAPCHWADGPKASSVRLSPTPEPRPINRRNDSPGNSHVQA